MLDGADKNPFLQEQPVFACRGEAHEFLKDITRQTPLANLTYFGMDVPQINAKNDYVISTYSQHWVARYKEQNYCAIDPVISSSLTSIMPFDWAFCCRDATEVALFFNEASEFGVKKQGMSLPIRGAQGETAIFSINADMKNQEWAGFKNAYAGHIYIMAFHFHLAILDLECGPKPILASLAPREVEVLQWAAAGKSTWDTGEILGISARTVQFYICNASVKLGAVNKTQAVATAVRYRLI